MASSVWTKPVDLRTLGRIANPLQNRCFACIRSSDNEHSELETWDKGGTRTLLCSHGTKIKVVGRMAGKGVDRTLDSADTLCYGPCAKHQLTTVGTRRYTLRYGQSAYSNARMKRRGGGGGIV